MGKKLPSREAIFKGMMAHTKKLNELINDLPDDTSSENLVDKFIGKLHSELSKVCTHLPTLSSAHFG